MTISRRLLTIVIIGVIAIIGVVVALVVTLANRPADSAPAAAPTSASAVAEQTVVVTVGAAGAMSMTYTDPSSATGVTTVSVHNSVKQATVKVPRGTTVRVSTSGGNGLAPDCWISDETDTLPYTRGTDLCIAVIN